MESAGSDSIRILEIEKNQKQIELQLLDLEIEKQTRIRKSSKRKGRMTENNFFSQRPSMKGEMVIDNQGGS
jgi:hypothetical protein